MSLIGEQVLLRIYLQSGDRAPHVPTYDLVLKAARKNHLAGATVLRGILGFGRRGLIPAAGFSFIRHEPVIVEIVDSPSAIAVFVQGELDRLLTSGFITLERAAVMMYRHREQDEPNQLHLVGELKPLSTLPSIQPGPHMKVQDNGVLLRVFIGESDREGSQPLYEAIVQKARELNLAGATVLRGAEGFGARSVVHRAGLLEMSTDLPVVIEIVDAEDKIKLLTPHLETMVREGMITMEYVTVLKYEHGQPGTPHS